MHFFIWKGLTDEIERELSFFPFKDLMVAFFFILFFHDSLFHDDILTDGSNN